MKNSSYNELSVKLLKLTFCLIYKGIIHYQSKMFSLMAELVKKWDIKSPRSLYEDDFIK